MYGDIFIVKMTSYISFDLEFVWYDQDCLGFWFRDEISCDIEVVIYMYLFVSVCEYAETI